MSLEAALDEERRLVMDILEGKKAPSNTTRSARAASPGAAQSPVRSMLDIGNDTVRPARNASIAAPGAGSHSGVTAPRSPSASASRSPPVIRSMLDPSSSPPPAKSSGSRISPPPSNSSLPSALGSPRSANPEAAYQFEMLPTIEAHSMRKRVTQGGKNKKKRAEQEANDAQSPLAALGPRSGVVRARHGSTGSMLSSKPMSPSRLRSVSPGGHPLPKSRANLNLMPDPHTFITDSGKKVDMHNAYRRLSDKALLRSGGALAELGRRKDSDASRSGDVAGSPRLQKDDIDEEALESSEEEDSDDESSSDDEWKDSSMKKRRGRGRSRREDGTDGSSKKPKSLLAAAEEERKTVTGTYRVRSLLEPSVTITGPDGEKPFQRRSGVHPNTSFDAGGASGVSTPVDSDAEDDISDIKRAQRLAMSISPIQVSNEACRCLRLILRGEYASLQREAEMGLRRQRVYLVATDLSEESAYALEWTIGTVLRDGDTMLAVYAVDEETGTGASTNGAAGDGGAPITSANRSKSNSGLEIGQGAAEAESLVKTMSNQQDSLLAVPQQNFFQRNAGSSAGGSSRTESPAPGSIGPGGGSENGLAVAAVQGGLRQPDMASMSKAERESYLATVEVSDRCVKLLRKTKLQVRVVVEVFRSKSPRHTLTEVIDYLDPTLVILGSRGRSALKGVLLGSFSNYLVTKSSVPVMVARKKLRKASKYKQRTQRRLSNVLANPTSKLVNAKID